MSDILTPNFGESVTSATVAAWHKNAGDPVAKGDTLVTLETDKVSTDLEVDESGVLEILVPEGAEAPIGAVLGRISPLDGSSAAPPSVPLETREKPASGPSSPVTGAAEQKPEKKTSSPDQTTSGKNGKTGKEASPRFIRKPMSPLRRTIAARLVEAQHQAAILTTFNECDMSSVMELRKQFHAEFRERHGTKLGFMSFFIKAVVKALQEVPQVNARIDGADIVENLYYDISVAIGTRKPVHAGSARRMLYHFQRRHVWIASFHPDSEPSPKRHSGHARHSGTPRGPGRPNRRPAHDVPRPFLRPPPGGRQAGRAIPYYRKKRRGKPDVRVMRRRREKD